MVKCCECNAEVKHLQWTHLRYKCTGNVGSMGEYREKYPNAKLRDDESSALSSITLLNCIRRYGEVEGQIRWDEYRAKQAYSNSLEFKKARHGWSEKEFKEYNNSRASTLANFINRHGEVEGLRKWEQYCDRQAFTNTLDYFIEREGSVETGTEAYLRINKEKASVHDPHWIAERYNISLDDALLLLSERRTSSFVSEGEKYFVDHLEKERGKPFKYTYKTKQFCLWSYELNQSVFYDIADTADMKIIEYNGDYWHANPKKYGPNDIISQIGLTAREIWEHDQLKILTAMKRGFTVEVVWESDFLKGR